MTGGCNVFVDRFHNGPDGGALNSRSSVFDHMAFTESEISRHLDKIEIEFWAKRRPPLELRDRVREGQRILGQSIELFFVYPAFQRPGEFIEESIAKLRYVRTRNVWELFWKRADLRFHRYELHPESTTLPEALAVIDEDAHGCFFG